MFALHHIVIMTLLQQVYQAMECEGRPPLYLRRGGVGATTCRTGGTSGLKWEASQIFTQSCLLAPNAGGVNLCLVSV